MSLIFEDLKKFLKKINLTNYEINAYFSLLKSDNLTAREISTKSRIPNGRIYDVLTSIHEYGLVDVQMTRPKKYKAINPNIALKTLITKKDEEREEETKITY
jgi:sugar-specific transcriptional regulator TrmB